MSCLANTVQANKDSFYFALAGGGGGGTNIQSPATVIPAANGSVDLNMITPAIGTGGVTLTMNAPNGGDVAVALLTNGNGNASLIMGAVGGDGVELINAAGTSGVLAINNTTTSTPYMLIDTVNNNVSIGATSGGGVAVGTVTVQEALIVKDGVGGANAVGISPTSAVASVISQTVASNGTLNIGSSIANPAGLTVSDVARVGQFNYVQVNGTPGSAPLLLQGAQGGGGICGIRPDAAAGSGSLVLGSDNTNTGQIILAATTTTIAQDTTFLNNVTIPNVLNFAGSGTQAGRFGAIEGFNQYRTLGVVCGDHSSVAIPQPAGMEGGLYFILAQPTVPGSTWGPYSLSSVGYWDSTANFWTWGGGGCCPALVSSPPSFIGIQGGGATLTLANGGGLGSIQMDFQFLQLGGLITFPKT